MSRITLYDKTGDKERRERLFDELESLGIDVRDVRGNRSTSELFRLLVQDKLDELEAGSHDS